MQPLSQTIELHARVFTYKDGTNAYARALLTLPVTGNVVSLKFITSSTPFYIKDFAWADKVQDPTADVACNFSELKATNVPIPMLDHIEEVLVNVHLPQSTIQWVALCYPIGDICRGIFRNMKAVNSALICHAGYKRLHNDEALLSKDAALYVGEM